jgi:acetolactate synthase-1/2/3 large subunit
MNCSTVIAKFLREAGIHHVFGYPGDPNVEVIEALRCEGLEFVLARREGTAGFMAQAYGQITGRPGVCLSTLGPGSSNLVNAVANAHLDRVPMLAFSGQIDQKREHTFTHQVLDHDLLFSPISKWAARIAPDTVGTVLRRAIRIAVAERPGPVHITTPADVVGAEATDDRIQLPPMAPASHDVQAFAAPGAADAEARLAAAKRPIALAGISALRAGATRSLTGFAESLGCPVVVAPMAKGVMPEDHAYFAGTLDMACNELLWEFLGTADLILAVGFDAVELIKPWSPAAPVIHIDSTPNTDQIYAAETEFVGPIGVILDHLKEASGGAARWTDPTDVIDVARAALPDDAIVSADVGSHKLLVGQGWTTRVPGGVVMTNGLSSMGYSLPAAMTAKLLMPDRGVACFIGDGGFAMVQGELGLAASLGLGLTIVVFCDNSLNRIELKQMARQYPSAGTRIAPTDMAKLAEAMGCDGVAVDSASALEKAFADGGAPDRPLVIGATIDPAQYAAQF